MAKMEVAQRRTGGRPSSAPAACMGSGGHASQAVGAHCQHRTCGGTAAPRSNRGRCEAAGGSTMTAVGHHPACQAHSWSALDAAPSAQYNLHCLPAPLVWPCTRRPRTGGRPRACSTVQQVAPSGRGPLQLTPAPPPRTEPRPPSRNLHAPRRTECAPLPVYVALESDVLSPQHTIAYEEALRVGLKAVRLLGVVGIAVDVAWSVVEAAGPQRYCWAGYRRLFDLIAGMGFKLQVSLCFHATEAAGLPPWVQAAAANNPDLYFADRAAARATECLTCGVDEVPALGGRTAVQVYSDLMASFKQEFEPLLADGTISTIVVGLGPRGELRYPSHPPTSAAAPSASTPASQRLWEYPGVGEFQCYDRYLLSSLKACAEQVRQPPWGLGGPHDAGSYTTWPHQSAFFAGAAGSWTSAYGRFFLQWYAEVLAAHGGRVMAAAASTFDGVTPPLGLQARLPAPYWWFNTPSHGAELTAGYYNTAQREGYLLPLSTLASAGAAGVQLGMAEARNIEHPSAHCVDPERLLLQQRAVAAALHMPVTLQNSEPRFDEPALARMHAALFEPATHLGIELPPPRALVFNYMSDAMFEPANWQRFKAFVRQVHARAGDLVGATAPAANRATARG